MVVHEEQSSSLAQDAPMAILVHGLGGDHRSPYMRRIASKLSHQGVRVWRVDLRGCGAGLPHAYRPAHAGTSGDLAAVIAEAQRRYSQARLTVTAFSLGGNILLKMLGEMAANPSQYAVDPARLYQAIAVAPPADLHSCCDNMERLTRMPYTRYYLKMLGKQVQLRSQQWEPWRAIKPSMRLRTIRQFDHWYTAPLAGFSTTDEYYTSSSAKQWLAHINVPTLLLLDEHDPIVPIGAFGGLTLSPHITVQRTRFGGHLGYIAAGPRGRTRRWMDEWTVARVTS